MTNIRTDLPYLVLGMACWEGHNSMEFLLEMGSLGLTLRKYLMMPN